MAGPDPKVIKALERDNKIGTMAYMEAERLFKVEDDLGQLTGLPAEDGTYVLKCTVTSGVASVSWVAEEE